MKKLILSMVAAVTSLTALAQPSPPDPFTQPGPAVEARVGIHRLMAANLMDVGALATGKKEWHGFQMLNRTDALEALSKMYFEYFMVPGSFEGSKAKASILDNSADFKRLATQLITDTRGLAHAARSHDGKSSGMAVVNIINSCNACHEKYMEPALLLPVPPPPTQAH
jgi:cytochrome c556